MGKFSKAMSFCRCDRCYHEWHPKGVTEPEICPKCKSPYWNRPRRKKKAERP